MAVILAATRSDLDVLATCYAALRCAEPSADIVVLVADSWPDETPATPAPQRSAFDLLAETDVYERAYTMSESAFVEFLIERAIDVLAPQVTTVVALPPRSLVLGALHPLRAVLASVDVEADPAFSVGWWGRRRGNHRTSRRHPLANELAHARDAAADSAVTILPRDRALTRLPGRVATVYAQHHQPARAHAYRFGQFSNGVPFDRVARALLREGLRGDARLNDPGDVYADPSYFEWLRAGNGTTSRYLQRYIELEPALRRRFGPPHDRPAEILASLRATHAATIHPLWLIDPARDVPQRAVSGTNGINVVGLLKAELGIGESGRSMARAIALAGEPVALLDVSSVSSSRAEDRTYSQFATSAEHAITLVCTNPPEYPALLRDPVIRGALRTSSYRIGNWWWELPELPRGWIPWFDQIDELWVGSRFVLDAAAAVSPVPVVRMPPIVDPLQTPPIDRREFGIPHDTTAFLTMFDYNSVLERKNPFAVIRAFTHAFHRDERTCLIIKTVNAQRNTAAHQLVLDATAHDKRIILLDAYLDRYGIARLIQACDAYVSLHRSEGFGLTIAESMAYGKPVVATAWSGNMDFTTTENSFLVDYRLVTLERDYGPYGAGSRWAEADTDHAALHLERIYRDERLAAMRAARARYDIRTGYSPAAIAALMRAQIDRIRALRPRVTAASRLMDHQFGRTHA